MSKVEVRIKAMSAKDLQTLKEECIGTVWEADKEIDGVFQASGVAPYEATGFDLISDKAQIVVNLLPTTT